MSEKVRIPFTFVVRKITFGGPDDASSENSAAPRTGLNDVSIPSDDINVYPTPELDEAIEQAWKEHVAKQKREAQQARHRAR